MQLYIIYIHIYLLRSQPCWVHTKLVDQNCEQIQNDPGTRALQVLYSGSALMVFCVTVKQLVLVRRLSARRRAVYTNTLGKKSVR